MDQMKAADPHCTKPISRREVLRLAMGSLIYTLPLRARKKEAAIAPAALALTRRLEDFVDRRQLAGVVASVTRGGRPLYRQAVGYQELESGKQMRMDTIFDIRSMTKAITAIAVMCLLDDGKLRLKDAVATHLPEFANLGVAEAQSAKETLRAPARPVTLLDLLTHTSGMSQERPPEIANITRVLDRRLSEVVEIISRQPMATDPGKRWEYSSMGYAILGRVVEVISGEPYERFVEKRVLYPLHMGESFFFPPQAKWPRIAAMYNVETGDLRRDSIDIYRKGAKYSAPEFGLFSTADDLDRLFQMMLNNGRSRHHRILSPQSSNAMLQPHVDTSLPGVAQGLSWFICTDAEKQRSLRISKGSFGVAGASGTFGWADPDPKLVRIFLTQRFGGDDTARNAFMESAAAL